MSNPFQSVRDLEESIADFAGSKYAVAVDSCTNALFLALKYCNCENQTVHLPKRTYVSVPCSVIHAGGKVKFEDLDWKGHYQLKPFPIYDAAKRFTKGMYVEDSFYCLSFHAKKKLAIGRGGMILTNDKAAYEWFKLARFDGRSEVDLNKDNFQMIGWNYYMTPEQAARGLWLFHSLKNSNNGIHEDLIENPPYPDLSQYKVYTNNE
jgi:dTDP-4-amino-4,6-dideoxygalactose transaminase|tara:strand:- start:293 stop:913 length:621 start_codon:yes stop_codon:yes gene_type:complete